MLYGQGGVAHYTASWSEPLLAQVPDTLAIGVTRLNYRTVRTGVKPGYTVSGLAFCQSVFLPGNNITTNYTAATDVTLTSK